jgi:hypothetical protein
VSAPDAAAFAGPTNFKTRSGFGTAEAWQLSEDNAEQVADWLGTHAVLHREPHPSDEAVLTWIYIASASGQSGLHLNVGYWAVKAEEAPEGLYILSDTALHKLYEEA